MEDKWTNPRIQWEHNITHPAKGQSTHSLLQFCTSAMLPHAAPPLAGCCKMFRLLPDPKLIPLLQSHSGADTKIQMLQVSQVKRMAEVFFDIIDNMELCWGVKISIFRKFIVQIIQDLHLPCNLLHLILASHFCPAPVHNAFAEGLAFSPLSPITVLAIHRAKLWTALLQT